MAHLEVEPKPSRPWWVWAILFIILLAVAAILFRKCSAENTGVKSSALRDSTSTNAAVSTAPDWDKVDFNSTTTNDVDITDSDIATRANANYIIYSLGENILFPSDGNDVSVSGQAKLKMISSVLQKRYQGSTIGVFGSTDSKGDAKENSELGLERAEAVKNWLTSTGEVSTETISVHSLGEAEPVATNQTKDGRQQNRNVSIVIFPKK